jgi:hypothetical protein
LREQEGCTGGADDPLRYRRDTEEEEGDRERTGRKKANRR